LKITFIIPRASTAGGIRVVAIYAKKLSDLGHEVSVISVMKKGTIRQRLRSLIKERRRFSSKSNTVYFDKLKDVKFEIKYILKNLKPNQIPNSDVVIATWWETAKWVNDLPLSKGEKLYLIQGYEVFPALPRDQVEDTYRSPLKKIVVSKWLQNIMAEKYGDLETTLIGNGVDTEHFQSKEVDKKDDFVVGHLYSRALCKNSQRAIDAIQIARKKISGIKFIGFGSKSLNESENEFDEYFVTPEQNRIPEIYSSVNVWLFSSDEEGFGLPILEAMACGTPVIATRAGASTELLSNGGGILLKGFTSEEMADAIIEISKLDKNSSSILSSKCRQISLEYSWDKLALKLEKELLEITSNQSDFQG